MFFDVFNFQKCQQLQFHNFSKIVICGCSVNAFKIIKKFSLGVYLSFVFVFVFFFFGGGGRGWVSNLLNFSTFWNFKYIPKSPVAHWTIINLKINSRCDISRSFTSDFNLENIGSKHGVPTWPGHLLTLVFHPPVLEPHLQDCPDPLKNLQHLLITPC